MERARAGWWRTAAVLPLVSCLSLGCHGGPRRVSTITAGAGGLVDGPTRWLMLPEEMRQAQRLRTTREAVDFVEAFWRRRDPDPGAPGNELAKTFYERVDAADRLYSEGGARGSLTDRGRALILLGPPPVLRYSQRKVPAWDPGKPGARPAIQTRNLVLEIWVYPRKELPPELAERIEEGKGEIPEEVSLTFLVEERRIELIDGEEYLEMAVRAAVRDPSP